MTGATFTSLKPHTPIRMETVDYYRRNIGETPLVTIGEDKHISTLSCRSYYAEQSSGIDKSVILPVSLTVRPFANVSLTDLEIWENESTNEISNEETLPQGDVITYNRGEWEKLNERSFKKKTNTYYSWH